jgi:hypothetical protein
MMKSRMLGFVGRVLLMGEMRSIQEILMRNSKGRGQLEDLVINGNNFVVSGYRLDASTSG